MADEKFRKPDHAPTGSELFGLSLELGDDPKTATRLFDLAVRLIEKEENVDTGDGK